MVKKDDKEKDDLRTDITSQDIPDLNLTIEELNRVKSELDQVKVDHENLQNQLKRAVADYQNLEKRVADGRQEFANWANTELIKKLLQVLDYYEKALEGVRKGQSEKETEGQSGWVKGVEMATVQFKNVLKQEGLDEISADGKFDPSLHEAVDTRDGKDGEILEVVEKGYNLNGKVIKPVKVVVGRKQ